jgi:hypothetical protein
MNPRRNHELGLALQEHGDEIRRTVRPYTSDAA